MAKKHSIKDMLKALKQPLFLFAFLMGFASGFPLFLTSKTMQGWLVDEGVDIKALGVFALVGLPYSLKFLWAPFVDKYALLGSRRRGWLLLVQTFLFIALMTMSLALKPSENLLMFGILAVIVAFLSATQDIIVDAYRIETLGDPEELALGNALYTYGYRLAMLLTGGAAFVLAGNLSWKMTYLIMAIIFGVNILVTLKAPEPTKSKPPPAKLQDAVILPFKDFLMRPGALAVLLFFVLYKVGDNMGGQLLTKLYRDIGYSNENIGYIAKGISPAISWAGPVLGGTLVFSLGIYRALWVAGFIQAFSTFAFAILSIVGKNLWVFGAVVAFEDLSASIGSIAFITYMASICNTRYTATQYALLSSLASLPRTFIAAPTGVLFESLGSSWFNYYTFCAFAAIPGMLLLIYIRKHIEEGASNAKT